MTTATAALPGALRGLRALNPADLTRFKAAVAAAGQKGWAFYLPYLLTKVKPGHGGIFIAEDDGSLCVFESSAAESSPRLDLVFPPLPMNPAVLARALERANDFNGDRSARVKRIDEKDAGAVASLPALRVKQRRAQYLFAPARYEQLSGNDFRTLRRNLTTVARLTHLEVVPIARGHVDACRELLARWQQAHLEAHGTGGGAGASRRALALVGTMDERDLGGEVVLLDGRVVAFALAGEIRPGLACSFERKCETLVNGLSYFQLRSLLLRLRNFDLVNDASDAGHDGLRQFKDRFRPIAMHAEFRATQS
jgi:hypothetical protein